MQNIFRNIVLLTIFSVIAFSYFSCNNKYTSIGGNCIGCFSDQPDQPDSSFLIVKVSINDENPKVPLAFYHGNFDPNKIPYFIDTTISSTYKYYVPLNNTYSVQALYKSGSKTIMAFDGSIFNVQKQDGCNNTCWQLIGGTLDVRLKNY